MGVAAGFLAILAYGHLISMRLAVLIFHLAEFATREIIRVPGNMARIGGMPYSKLVEENAFTPFVRR